MVASLQAICRPPIADSRDYTHKQYDISSTGYGHKSLLIVTVHWSLHEKRKSLSSSTFRHKYMKIRIAGRKGTRQELSYCKQIARKLHTQYVEGIYTPNFTPWPWIIIIIIIIIVIIIVEWPCSGAVVYFACLIFCSFSRVLARVACYNLGHC